MSYCAGYKKENRQGINNINELEDDCDQTER